MRKPNKQPKHYGQLDLLEWAKTAPAEKPPEAPRPVAVNVTVAPPSATGGPILDFGNKIAGAKKDLWQEYQRSMSSSLPDDDAEITLSRHFPEPNYESLMQNGVDFAVLAAVKALRDEIPAKPKVSWKLKRWAESVRQLRDFANGLIAEEWSLDELKQRMSARGVALHQLAKRLTLYAELGYPAFTKAKGWKVVEAAFSCWRGQHFNPAKTFFSVEREHRIIDAFETYDEAFAKLAAMLGAQTPSKETSLDIYRITRTGDVVIGKKVAASKYIDLKTGFASVKDARLYLAAHKAELLDLLDKKKEVRPERRSVNDPRMGPDYRLGQNVAPEAFLATFGLRGVQFGNYVEQARRVADLNNAFDALTDLAALLDVEQSALSLSGSLGLAFGARGSGGRNAAAAHYEPTHVVINLTKTAGAGSLAHEWWHGFDNDLGRREGDPVAYASENFLKNPAISGPVAEGFQSLVSTIRGSDYFRRSWKLDQTRAKDYWSTIIETTARAFETFVIARMDERGQSNDYLANIVSEPAHAATNALVGDDQPYPYPTAAERPALNQAFGKLFAALKGGGIFPAPKG